MTHGLFRCACLNLKIPLIYVLICVIALLFDFLTDRSFGALMLSVIPISLVALTRLLLGPWLKGREKGVAARDWFCGAVLVFAISVLFASLGSEQAKAGELIYTYGVLLIGLPGSLMHPFVQIAIEPILGDGVFFRIFYMWLICLVLGWLEWRALDWIYAAVRLRFFMKGSASCKHRENDSGPM
jgi:hypothetical protein